MFKDYNRHLIFSILIFDIAVLIFTWYATNKLIQENVTFLGVSANGSTKVAIIALLTAFNFYTIRSFLKYNSEKHKLISDVELKRISKSRDDIIIQIIVHIKGDKTAYINNPVIKINLPTEIKVFNTNPVSFVLSRSLIGKEIIINAEKAGYKLRKPINYQIENNDKPFYIALIPLN
jgi:hypothetical protein